MAKDLKQLKIGIIGGDGKMGRFFSRALEGVGCVVSHSDLPEAPKHERVVEECDVLIFAVPLGEAERVIAQIAPATRSQQLLIDLSSLKEAPLRAMGPSEAEILLLHPMFAPDSGNFQNRTVLVVREREREKTKLFLDFLSTQGAKLTETTADLHDKMMAVIQGLTHFGAIATAAALSELGVNIDQSLEFASPVYRLRMDMVGRIMAQSPGLYADIALCNPHTVAVLESLQNVSEQLYQIVKDGDREAFVGFFNKASQHLGKFRDEALQESNRLITVLSEKKG